MTTTFYNTAMPRVEVASKIIDFKRESFSLDLLDEMMPLLKNHYGEIALYKDIPLSPAKSTYENADKAGFLRIYTMRHNHRLVGYEVFFIHKHPHYSETLEAVQDILFLSPEMRRGLLGYQFLKWCDGELENDGAQVIFRCVSNRYDYSPLLKRLGFMAHDTVYSRRVR